MINPKGNGADDIKVIVSGEVIGTVKSVSAKADNGISALVGEVVEKKQPVGYEAQCWSCSMIYNISLLPADAKGVKCKCGGFVVTPSGKVATRPFYDAFDSMAPLLEVGDNEVSIILDENVRKPGRIILPGEE